MVWPIHVPSAPAPAGTTADAKPLDKVLNRIARGAIYQVTSAAVLPDLLAALAAAGEPAPSVETPVYADVLDSNVIVRNNGGATWRPMARGNQRGNVRAATTSAAGVIQITHGLGVVPTSIVYAASGFGGADAFTFRTESRNSTIANVVVYRNGAIASSYTFPADYGFDWVALA